MAAETPPWEEFGVNDADREAIGKIESGGRYDRLGPRTRTGDRAYGKYQVMGANIPVWSREALGRELTPEEFVSDPDAQEAVFAHRFGQYKGKYGGEGAARAWFAGERGMSRLDSRDVLGTRTGDYGSRYAALVGRPRPESPPPPVEDNRPPWEVFTGEGVPAESAKPPGSATAGESLARGYYKTKGMLGGFREVVGEAAGDPQMAQLGREMREQAAADVKSYPAQAEFLKIRSASDAAQYAKETILDFVPQVASSLAGAVAGGAVGGPIGAMVGGFAPSLILNTGDIQSQLKEKDRDAVAPGWVAAGGTAAAALDTVLPARIGSKLLMRFGKETGEQIAQETVARSTSRGFLRDTASEAGKSAAIEGTTEALQEVIGEFTTSGALDRPPEWEELPHRVVESFAAGALGGGVFGGGARAIMGREKEAAQPPGDVPWDDFPPTPLPGDVPAPPGPPPGDAPVAGPLTNIPVGEWEQHVPEDVVQFKPQTIEDALSSEEIPQEALASEQTPAQPHWYYSAVREAAERLPTAGSADQMLATLRNTPGVKQEELDALGIGEWIASQKGKVTKQDLISEIESRAIIVEDATKVQPRGMEAALIEERDALGRRVWRPPTALSKDMYIREEIRENGTPRFVIVVGERAYTATDELSDARNFILHEIRSSRRSQDPTQYSEYTVSGGQNYREHLLRLPPKMKSPQRRQADDKLLQEYRQLLDLYHMNNISEEEKRRFRELREQVSDLESKIENPQNIYLSGHWREENVIGHTRTKDRVMADGKTTLHMDEVQSDWHQTGRKKGYKGQLDLKQLEADLELLSEQSEAIRVRLIAAYDAEDAAYEAALEANRRRRDAERAGIIEATTPLEIEAKQANEQHRRTVEERDKVYEEKTAVDAAVEELNIILSEGTRAVPNAPFKTSWAELLFKRMVYVAASEGKDRVSWTPGEVQNTRWQRMGDEAQGMREFYDQILPRIAKKMANKLPEARFGHALLPVANMESRTDRLAATTPMPYFEMTERTRDAILGKGFALFNRMRDDNIENASQFTNPSRADSPWQVGDLADARPQLREAANVVWRIAKKLGITTPIEIVFKPGMSLSGTMGFAAAFHQGRNINMLDTRMPKPDSYRIQIFLGAHPTLEENFASLAHELGHIVQSYFYTHGASPLLKIQIDEAYQRALAERKQKGVSTWNELLMQRDNFLVNWFDMRSPPTRRRDPGGDIPIPGGGPLAMLSPGKRQYWLGFEEWFAEQVARHFTTSPVANNAVERFFSRLANALRDIYNAFKQKFTTFTAEPDAFIKGWLDARLTELPLVAAANDANKNAMADANVRAMEATGVKDYPRADMSATSIPGRKIISAVGETVEARAMAAAADRFNGFYKLMLSVVQVAARNLHIAPLQRYVELWQQKQLERAQMMAGAVETLRQWRNLGKAQADAVAGMIDDYMNYRFLTDQEQIDGIERRPTDVEVDKMAKDNGVNDAGKRVFRKVQSDFDTMLLRYEALLRAEALKIPDPIAQAKRLMEIKEQVDKMRNTAYAPAMRFGDLVIIIKGPDGKTVSRYHFETEGQRRRAEKMLRAKMLPGETLEKTAIPEQAKPFMGLPPGLLDLIAEKLTLSDDQRKVLDELKYEYAPAHGFAHRFQQKHHIQGYSQDFFRAYANYFFHGSNYFTNVKYVQPLRDEVGLVKLSAEGLEDGTKRIQIHNYMNEHLNYMLDPKPDFAHLRGLMFHWGLGFSPAAAFVNLTQMALGSYPFLAGKFGDALAVAAMTRAGTNVSTFYKRGTIAGMTTARDMRALNEGVKQGVITEAMAPELAGLSEQDNLRKGFSKSAELYRIFSEYSSFMFQTAEQINRRVTFRAAWQLALDNPHAKYVKDMVDKHSLQYESLIQQGWVANEAAAFVVAKDAVESTQFIYHQWANPKFMRGKLRSVFIFKNFLQNTLFMLWHYPETRVRALLVFAFLGGMMGLPGADDMKSLIKALGWRLFGKDWDVEDEARRLVISLTNGTVSPDLLLHGTSRYGFGAPAALALAGVPAPVLDMSRSIGLGRILPIDANTLLGQGASRDPKRAAIDSLTQMGGYAFQVNANFYNALIDSQMDINALNRWQKAMPRALAGLSRAWQAAPWQDDPAIRTRGGAAVVRFDPTDAAHMMEVLGMAAGFSPERLNAKWDLIMAEREAKDFWNLKREGLLRQLGQARSSGDQENYVRAIGAVRDFNANLPKEARAKAITADAIIESITRRTTSKVKMEAGLPQSESDIPLVRSIQQLYPDAQVDVRRVR